MLNKSKRLQKMMKKLQEELKIWDANSQFKKEDV